MWDWELIKSGSSQGRYEVLVQYTHEDFHYAHAISYDTEQNEYCLHNHALYELVYCVRGDVIYQAEGVRYQMEPHSLLLLAPAVLHKLFIRSEQPFERHTLYINYFDANSEMFSLMGKCLQLFNQQSVGSAYYDRRSARVLCRCWSGWSGQAHPMTSGFPPWLPTLPRRWWRSC